MSTPRPAVALSWPQRASSEDYLRGLAEHFSAAGATRVVLREVSLPPALQERLHNRHAVIGELEEAHRIRSLGEVPFWEALLLACSHSGRDVRDVIEGAGFHQPASSALREWDIPVESLPNEAGTSQRIAVRGNILTISSQMKTLDGAWRHLPMLDFRTPATTDTEAMVRGVSAALGGGLLARSGSSYHLYGNRLVELADLHAWLGHAAQYNPITDGRWIAHQHREGACALRISPRARDTLSLTGRVLSR